MQKTHKITIQGIFGILALLAFVGLGAVEAMAQEEREAAFPNVKVKNLKGSVVETGTFTNDGKPIVLNFWATWCKPCLLELSRINDVYDEWVEETGVKLIAISIDDSRNALKVAPFVNGQGWEFDVYIDENRDFARAMNVINVPFSFLLDGKRNIVWQNNAYSVGDEEHLFEMIKKLSAGESIE